MKRVFLFLNYFFCTILLLFLFSCSRQGAEELSKHTYEEDTLQVRQLLDSFRIYMDSNLIAKTFPYAERAFSIAEKNNYIVGMADALNAKGRYYSGTGDYPKAMECLLKSLPLNEQSKNEQKIARNYADIGIIHYNQKNYEEALQYYHKAAEINQKVGYNKGLAIVLYLMGLVKSDQGAEAEALDFLSRSLEIQRKLSDKKRVPELELAIGDIYLKRNEYSKALRFYDSATKHFLESGETMGIPSVNLSLAELFLKRNELDKSEKYAISACNYFKEINYKIRILDCYKILQKIYSAKNDYKNAYSYQSQTIALNDSVLGEETTKKLAAMQSQFELNKKETEIELVEKQIKTQRTLRNFFMAGFAVVALLAFLTYRQYRVKNLTANKLEETLQHLKATQEQLVYTEKMSSLGTLSAGIAHEIQNPLNFVNNFSDLGIGLIDEFQSSKTLEEKNEIFAALRSNLTKINEHGKRADGIVKSMLEHTHIGSREKRPTDLNYLANEFFTLAYQSFRATEPGFTCQVEKQFDKNLPQVNVNPQDISRVMINLFNNALHAVNRRRLVEKVDFSPSITLQSRLESNRIYFSVRDNGTGIPQEIIDKIFQPFFTTKSIGEGTGLGLSLSHEIITQGHGGTLEVKNQEGEGAEFIITLPV